jgi:hypothetical protein
MAVTLSLFAGVGAQFFDNNGVMLSGGKIYSYQAGTTTPLATYTSNSESAFHSNPIILDSSGRVPSGGEIWLQMGIGYKFVVKTSNEVLIATYDNIPSSAQPPAANDADSIMYEQGYTVTAGSFIAGKIYRIVSIGTTNFTLIGAISNTVGLHFIATGVGTGTGTAELSQTVETKLRETVSANDFGADPTGVANSTTAFQAAIDNGFSVSLGDGTYKVSNAVLKQQTQIDGNGALITPFSNSSSIFNLEQSSWQIPAYQGLKNIAIDAAGYSGISAITQTFVGSGGNSALVLENIRAFNYDTIGFDLQNNQFGRFTNLEASGNSTSSIGYYLRPIENGGGGNSNTFNSIISLLNAVGVIIDGDVLAFSGPTTWQSIANNFINPQTNGNLVCAMAFFDAQVNIYGGSPEANGGGAAASFTYGGKTIPRCSMYLNKSFVNIYGIRLEENSLANSGPAFIVENNSTLTLTNSDGYGKLNANTFIAKCDDSSSVSLNGLFYMVGSINNVISYPATFRTNANGLLGLFTALYGVPVLENDSTIPFIISEQAPSLNTFGGSPAVASYVYDNSLGFCIQLACSATAFASVNTIDISGLTANSDLLISFLIKSDRDCLFSSFVFDGTGARIISNDGSINLKANIPQRVVLSSKNYRAGASGQLQIINWDTTAPVVKISNLTVYQGLTASANSQRDIAKIVNVGAFNPGDVNATQTQLLDKTSSVNTVNKYTSKQVWDSTNNRVLFAGGRTDVSVWKDGVNSTVYTPV